MAYVNSIILIAIVGTTNIVLAIVYGDCQINDSPIKTCCCLGYNSTYFNAKRSGVYTMANFCGVKCSNTRVYCDTTSGGGGWLVIQRRDNRYSTSFHRTWTEYVDGFGDLYQEFWYGLNAMYCLTNKGNWELRIDFTFSNGTKSFMHYNHFKVGMPSENFRLSISGFTGITPDDPFTTWALNGQQFSTYDRDNDKWHGNCAMNTHGSTAPGGWWYSDCFCINLNYNHDGPQGFMKLAGTWHSPIFIETKIRPVNCEIS